MEAALELFARAANVDHVNDPLPPDIAAEDKGPAIVATVCTMAGVMTLFVSARLWTRTRVLGALQLDDWLIIASLICTWVATGLSVAANEHGAGRHVRALTQQQLHDAIFYTMIGFVPSLMSFGVPKLAIVALLTRITNPSRFHRIFLWALSGSCFAALCLTLVIEFAQCNPVSSLWDKTILPPEKKCWDPRVNVYFAYFSGSYSAFVDFYLAVYPSVVLFKLQMAWKKKLALSSALSLGGVAAFVAIYKCTRLPSLASKDYTYDTADLVIWTSTESNTLIIATCIPILQPLIDRIFGRRFLSGARTRAADYAYGNTAGGGGYSRAGGPSIETKPGSPTAFIVSRPERVLTKESSVGSRSPTSPRYYSSHNGGSTRKRHDLDSSLTDGDDGAAGGRMSDSQESILGLESTVRSAAAHHHSTSAAGTKKSRSTVTVTAGGGGVGATGRPRTPSRSRGMTTATIGTGPPHVSVGAGGDGMLGGAGMDGDAVGLAVLPPAGTIMRTDVVTVSYDARSQLSEDGKRDSGEGGGALWRPRHF